MQPFVPRFYPDSLDSRFITLEMVRFIGIRAWLIARFGVRDKQWADISMALYCDTIDPKIVQVHVGKTDANGQVPSVVISVENQFQLWTPGFLRWRYASLEEEQGQYANSQTPII